MSIKRKLSQLVAKAFSNENSSLIRKNEEYPQMIILPSTAGILHFEAFSPVEKHRIANYGGEKEFLDCFTAVLKADDVVFDIGASVGLMTVHAAAFVNVGKVIAFEPDPETHKRLLHNVQLNRFANVSYVSWAVSNEESETVLFSDGASGFAPTLQQQKDRPGAPKGEVKIKTKPLDESINNKELPLPNVIKIDIEGAEILCIKGALKLLNGEFGKKPRVVFLELHPEFLPSFNSSAEEVHNLMLDSGYKVIWEQKREGQVQYCYQSNTDKS